MLETTDLTVKEIAVQVGLPDVRHAMKLRTSRFVTDFKRRYGLPPRQYRTRYYETLPDDKLAQRLGRAS